MGKRIERESQLHRRPAPCHTPHRSTRGWLDLARFRAAWQRWPAAAAGSSTESILELGRVPAGETVRIRTLRGGHSFLSRLACLGFTPGVCLRVVQNFGSGPIIVSLRDTRIALGRGEASRIEVERLAGGDGAA